ncbi:MAG: glycosyl hydrolase family 65 protein [Bacillota bacterium]|nr:glycosyl hydrolase family 65 protein [Bacillota bacterium]
MKKIYRLKDFPIDEKALMLQETLFHNANGYLGVRGNLEEGLPQEFNTMRGTYLNGFYDVIPMKQSESLCNLVEEKDTMLNVADFQSIEIFFDGERFSMLDGRAEQLCRTLDMDAGITERSLAWHTNSGKHIQICFRRMASFVRKNMFTIECRLKCLDADCGLDIHSHQKALVRNYSNPADPRVGQNNKLLLHPTVHLLENGTSVLECETTVSSLKVCTAVQHELSRKMRESISYDEIEHSCTASYSGSLKKGEELRLVKYIAVCDSRREAEPVKAALSYLGESFGELDELYEEQAEYLESFWERSLLHIETDDDSGLAMVFNQYQLLQSVGSDGICGTASKGLSGEGYEGHYFWDTEIYILPFLSCTNPELARCQLGYRYATLELARENAKLLGHKKGVLFPWRTVSGRECSGFFPAGSAQYHINGDIAYAVVQYYLMTGDFEYMAKEGAEILIETARLWMDVGNYSKGKFVINDVTGPDEYTCIVNNNYYTNASAKYNLTWAVKAARLLSDRGMWQELEARLGVSSEELEGFGKAAEAMLLPYDEALGINPQDDSFLSKPIWDFENTPKENYPLLLHYHPLCLYRHQVCKQADTVLAYFLFDGIESRETMLSSFEYYEKLTTHDSSLSNCVFSIVAARLGLKDKARSYFGDSIRSDLVNSYGNTGDGIHTANMGGSYMTIVYGFAGMTVTESGIGFAPSIPDDWRSYSFRIGYMGRSLEISVNTEKASVRLLSGEALDIRLFGQLVRLNDKTEVSI